MTASMETPTIRQRVESRIERARERRRRAARTWLGLAGLAYDAGRSLLEAAEELRDKAEARGEEVEADLNTRTARIQDTVRGKLDKRRLRIRAHVDSLAQRVSERGQEVEQALKQKMPGSVPAAREPSAPQDRRIEIEVEAVPVPPVEGFDALNAKQVIERIASLDRNALKDVRAYEEARKNRVTILREIDRLLAA